MRRPLGIWIIVVMQSLLALGLLLGGMTGIDLLSDTPGATLGPEARAFYVLWALISLLFAYWLWRLEHRGWVLTMVLTGLGLAANLVLWWAGEPDWIRMGIQAVIAFYLNSVPVRQRFLAVAVQRDGTLLGETES